MKQVTINGKPSVFKQITTQQKNSLQDKSTQGRGVPWGEVAVQLAQDAEHTTPPAPEAEALIAEARLVIELQRSVGSEVQP